MWWLVLLAVASAKKDKDPEPEAGEPPSAMAGHFVNATHTMLSVAGGRLKQARKYARDLSATTAVPQPVRTAADQVKDCKDVECAGPAIADLARTCSECHQEGGRGPRPTGIEVLPGRNAAERHAWAALFLWMGAIVPEQTAWDLGIQGMVPPIDLDHQDDLIELKSNFVDVVAEARSAQTWDERAEGLGGILTGCAGCHKKADIPVDKW